MILKKNRCQLNESTTFSLIRPFFYPLVDISKLNNDFFLFCHLALLFILLVQVEKRKFITGVECA